MTNINPSEHLQVLDETTRLLTSDWLHHTPPRLSVGAVIGGCFEVTSVKRNGRKYQLLEARSVNRKDPSVIGKVYMLKAINSDQIGLTRVRTHLEWMRATAGHENRTPMLTDFIANKIHFMVFATCHFTLRDVLNDQSLVPLPPQHVQEFSLQLVNAVLHIHRQFSMHGDICPENVGVIRDDRVATLTYDRQQDAFVQKDILYCTKIQIAYYGDLGLRGTLPGTDQYRAPEVIFGYKFATWSDCYSVGCVIAEMLTGIPIFPPCDEGNPLYRNEKALLYDAISGRFPEEMAGKIEMLFPRTMDLSEIRPLRMVGISPAVERCLESAVFIEWMFEQEDTAIGEVISGLVKTNNRSRHTMSNILLCEYFKRRNR